jgi:hypothetical protein
MMMQVGVWATHEANEDVHWIDSGARIVEMRV